MPSAVTESISNAPRLLRIALARDAVGDREDRPERHRQQFDYGRQVNYIRFDNG